MILYRKFVSNISDGDTSNINILIYWIYNIYTNKYHHSKWYYTNIVRENNDNCIRYFGRIMNYAILEKKKFIHAEANFNQNDVFLTTWIYRNKHIHMLFVSWTSSAANLLCINIVYIKFIKYQNLLFISYKKHKV